MRAFERYSMARPFPHVEGAASAAPATRKRGPPTLPQGVANGERFAADRRLGHTAARERVRVDGEQVERPQASRIGAAAALLASSVLLSRLFGYARESLLAYRAGAG